MPENAASFLAELEDILGLTTEEAAAIEVDREKRVPKWSALMDTYRAIVELARRELQSAYDHLFQLVGEMGAPMRPLMEAFAEQEKASGPQPRFAAVKAQFDELLRSHGTQTEGELYLPVNRLLIVVQCVFRPRWGRASFNELARDLETIIRLATPLRNAIGWVLVRATGLDGDEQKRERVEKQVNTLWYQHTEYEGAFAPEVRRRILYKEPGIWRNAALIFSPSENARERPAQTVATAARLETPAREGALSFLAFGLAVYLLHSPDFGESHITAICARLKPLMPYVVRQLFASDKVEKLTNWMVQAENAFSLYRTHSIEEELGVLTERVASLESMLSAHRLRLLWDKKTQEPLRVLLANILEFLRDETVHPQGRWLGREMGIAGNYFEFLWENAVDDAFGNYSTADDYIEWEWLELRRSIKELTLTLGTDTLNCSYGWRT